MNAQGPRRNVFLYSPELESYSYPPDNPFRTERATMTRDILLSHGLLSGEGRSQHAPPAADRDALEKFHTSRYLDAIVAAEGGHLSVEGLEMGLGTPDCPVFQGMYRCAALACGATLAGAGLILDGEADVAFNPSGGHHHAGPERASGFCYVNDVALACLMLAERGRRVLYLDVDVHHGDGVQNAFYDRRDVMTISLHQSGKTLFPGTGSPEEIGTGEGRGYSVNVPLPPGTYDEPYLRAFQAIVPPLVGVFDPEAIVLELGMDGLSGDPLAGLSLTNNAYASIVEAVMGFGRPILATGGGGYNPDNTARGWALAWCVFCGECDSHDDLAGLGGVMLESTDWSAGLRDRVLVPDTSQRVIIDVAVNAAIRSVKENVFALHGL
ncbi:MAG: acetoin utilization protein AcuC [Phycisphaerae bacterium]